ncbi:MAG: hypothetical protein KF720_06235 [Rubrivivax sp.]|nr:hypothetical protein [Rubrivivax sp.]
MGMKMESRSVVFGFTIAGVIVLSGCAGVTFYKDAGLSSETGIPVYYGPKPYVLVTRTGAKDKPVDVSVVYLTDESKVVYAKPKSGFGSSNLTMSLVNGQLTAFGQQVDTKIPEIMGQVAGLITARGAADKAAAEADKIRSEITTKQAASTAIEAGKKVEAIAKDIGARAADLPGLSSGEITQLKSVAQALSAAAKALVDAEQATTAPKQYDAVKAQKKILDDFEAATASTARDNSLRIVHTWGSELGKVLDESAPKEEKPPQATFELYEIVQTPGKPTVLRRVQVP